MSSSDWDLIRRSLPECRELSEIDFDRFVAVCKRTGLDPMTGQIVPQVRRSKKTGPRMSIIVKIDGLRLIAQRSGGYEGQTPAEWCGADGEWRSVWVDKGPPSAARVGVFRTGFREPLFSVATWRAYAPEYPSGWWSKGPEHMLSKCAEALALRRAFPQETSGLYTAEELASSGAEATAEPPRHAPESAPPQPKQERAAGRPASDQRDRPSEASATGAVLSNFQALDKNITIQHLEALFGPSSEWTDETKKSQRTLYVRTRQRRDAFWFEVSLSQFAKADPSIGRSHFEETFGPPEVWTANTRSEVQQLMDQVHKAGPDAFWSAHGDAVNALRDGEAA